MLFIKEWVITIVSVIIFLTFVEILMPNSSYKRYINVVIGFLLIIVILTPLTRFISGQINLEEEIIRTFNDLEISTFQNRANRVEYSNKEAIIKLYKAEIKGQIKNHIEASTDYIVNQVGTEIEENIDSEEFGLIKELNISIKDGNRNLAQEKNIIRPVDINIGLNKKNTTTREANSIIINTDSDLIKTSISSLYGLPKDKINIVYTDE